MAWYWTTLIIVVLAYIYFCAAVAVISIMIKKEPFLEDLGLLKIVVLGLIWPLTIIGMLAFIWAMRINEKEKEDENH